MIKDYLQAGYPALCVLTQEPRRAEQLLSAEGWKFFSWDCLQGIRDLSPSGHLSSSTQWVDPWPATVTIPISKSPVDFRGQD